MTSTSIKETTISIGDTLKVKTTVVEGGKSRIQTFQGILIALSGRGENQMMTVRRVGARGIGVERKWPVNSRALVGVDVVKKRKKIRRSKLYYLRNLTGRAATQV